MSDSRTPRVTELGPDHPTTDADRPTPAPRTAERLDAVRAFVIEAARLLSDSHCSDIVVFDVTELSDVTDFIIIASGTSDRQIRSVADDVTKLAKESDLEKFGRDEDGPSTWVVLDLIEAIVHLFEPNTRAHYDLEMMWGDAPRVEWKRE